MSATMTEETIESTGHASTGRLDWDPLSRLSRQSGLRNLGKELDALLDLLPPGPAREFVRGLPHRARREELIASLEALVRLLQLSERG